jgi:hypothetical protein
MGQGMGTIESINIVIPGFLYLIFPQRASFFGFRRIFSDPSNVQRIGSCEVSILIQYPSK